MVNVVVAEPNETLRTGIISVIAETGRYRIVSEAHSRAELVAALRLGRCDLVLLEPRIGGATGETFIRQLRQIAPEAAILGFSDLNEIKFGARLLRAGLKGFLNKSCEKSELLAAIDQVSCGRAYITAALAEELALGLGSATGEQPHERLSARELDVFCRLVRGERIGAIAGTLYLSPKTVSTHKLRIFQKMGVSNLSELVRYALANNLAEQCD